MSTTTYRPPGDGHDPLCGNTQRDRIAATNCRDCTLIIQAQGRAARAVIASLNRDGVDDFALAHAVEAVLMAGRR